MGIEESGREKYKDEGYIKGEIERARRGYMEVKEFRFRDLLPESVIQELNRMRKEKLR